MTDMTTRYTFDFSRLTVDDIQRGASATGLLDLLELVDKFCVGGIRHMLPTEVLLNVMPQFSDALKDLVERVKRETENGATGKDDDLSDADLRELLDGIDGL